MPLAPPIPVKTLDPGSVEHAKEVQWILDRLDHSADGKAQVEREALIAEKHYASYLDVKKHRFPVKTYDPVYFASRQAIQANAMEAIFGNPPVFDYAPQGDSTSDEALLMSRLVEWHMCRTRDMRGQVEDALITLGNAGTAFMHAYWDYQEQVCGYWQRTPRLELVLNPMTLQLEEVWIDDGSRKWVKHRKPIMDSPRTRNIPIYEAFPDDTEQDIERGQWFCTRTIISPEEARANVKTMGWNKKAVELAIDSDYVGATTFGGNTTSHQRIMDRLEWMAEIGLRVESFRDHFDPGENNEFTAVEVIECWRKRKQRVERLLLLNRVAIALYSLSPINYPGLPFVKCCQYRLPGQFWGLSDYHVCRWLIQGIQTMRNAVITESLMSAMPPMVLDTNSRVEGKRYEPGAEWRVEGGVQQLQFLQRNPGAIAAGAQEAQMLMQQLDRAMGSSEVGRGNPGQMEKVAATTVNLAMEAAGRREKLLIDNFSYECIERLADMHARLIQQNHDYAVQLALDPNPNSMPVTVYPEMFESSDLIAIPTAATSAMKATAARRAESLYRTAIETGEPNVDRRALWEHLVDTVAPQEKTKIIPSPEQVMMAQRMGLQPGQMPTDEMVQEWQMQQAMAQAPMPQAGPMGPGAGAPVPGMSGPMIPAGPPPVGLEGPVPEMAAELREAVSM